MEIPITRSSLQPESQGVAGQQEMDASSEPADRSFSQELDLAQQATGSRRPPVNRWQSLTFLKNSTPARFPWTWSHRLNQANEAMQGSLQTLSHLAALPLSLAAQSGQSSPPSLPSLTGHINTTSLPRPSSTMQPATGVPATHLQPPLRSRLTPISGIAASAPVDTHPAGVPPTGTVPGTIGTAPVTLPATDSPAVTSAGSFGGMGSTPMRLVDYPRPAGDNGRGIHWIPTVNQSREEVDRYVAEAVAMGMKWVVFLNEGASIGANDYLVRKLTEAGIEPVMRVYTPGLVPIEGDLGAMVSHYRKLGVDYFQLYNEPNLMVETGGKPPDPEAYIKLWSRAAEQVIAAGGLPGFGALSPQGEMDDRTFLREALNELKEQGRIDLLDRGWLSSHNYAGARALNDPDGFLRFKQYDNIIREALGRSIPIIGTEAGSYATGSLTEEKRIELVTGAYNYMAQREPYNFSFTYWIIANGHDPAWEEHALFRNGTATALARALQAQVTGGGIS